MYKRQAEIGPLCDAPFSIQLGEHDLNGVDMGIRKILVGAEEVLEEEMCIRDSTGAVSPARLRAFASDKRQTAYRWPVFSSARRLEETLSLIHILQKEQPELFTAESVQALREMMREGVEQEIAWGHYRCV